MMRSFISLCALAALCSTDLNAQTVNTIPAGYAKKEGARSRHVPLRYLPARIQSGFGPKATGWKATRLIRELWVRPDGPRYLTTGFSCDMQIKLSSKGCNPRVPSNTFAANHGTDKVVFMAKKTYKIAPFKTSVARPRAFMLQLKGDRPFVWTTPSLVVDWATYASATQANTDYYVDATNLASSSSLTYFGTPCNPTNFFNYATGNNVGDEFRTYGYTRTAGDIVLSFLGTRRTAIKIGNGCTLHTLPTLVHPTPVKATGTTGYANFSWGKLPASVNGAKVINQLVAFDGKGGVRWSRGADITIGSFPFIAAHRYNYAFGSTKFDPDKDPARFGWERTAIIFEVK